MTIPTSNVRLAGNIQAEFGGAAPVALSEYYRGGGGGYVPISQGNAGYGFISASGPIYMGNFRNQTKTIPGNSGIILSSGWYNLPPTSGTQVTITVIGGGGGGGGGPDRAATGTPQYRGGGAGGGGGGAVYRQTITVIPGSSIYISIGAGGSAGQGWDPGTSGGFQGTNGGGGGITYAQYNSGTVVQANGGTGGQKSLNFIGSWSTNVGTPKYTPGGSAGAGGIGTQLYPGEPGENGFVIFDMSSLIASHGGGYGAYGSHIDGSQQTRGQGGIGGAQYPTIIVTPRPALTGTNYGGGGGGAGANQTPGGGSTYPFAYQGAAGGQGAAYISWP